MKLELKQCNKNPFVTRKAQLSSIKFENTPKKHNALYHLLGVVVKVDNDRGLTKKSLNMFCGAQNSNGIPRNYTQKLHLK